MCGCVSQEVLRLGSATADITREEPARTVGEDVACEVARSDDRPSVVRPARRHSHVGCGSEDIAAAVSVRGPT